MVRSAALVVWPVDGSIPAAHSSLFQELVSLQINQRCCLTGGVCGLGPVGGQTERSQQTDSVPAAPPGCISGFNQWMETVSNVFESFIHYLTTWTSRTLRIQPLCVCSFSKDASLFPCLYPLCLFLVFASFPLLFWCFLIDALVPFLCSSFSIFVFCHLFTFLWFLFPQSSTLLVSVYYYYLFLMFVSSCSLFLPLHHF